MIQNNFSKFFQFLNFLYEFFKNLFYSFIYLFISRQEIYKRTSSQTKLQTKKFLNILKKLIYFYRALIFLLRRT